MQLTRRHIVCAAFAAAPLATLSTPVAAQSGWPSKPITIVVAYPAGGDSDLIGRVIAEKLSPRLKVPVLVDNRPGAAGTIGNAFVSRSAPDGYTLLLSPNTLTTSQQVIKVPAESRYDVLSGFEPILLVSNQPLLLVANPRTGFKSMADMIQAAKSGKPVAYATPGSGSPMHIVAEWLGREAGVKFVHVPYKGMAPSVADVVAGHVDTAWLTPGVVSQYMAEGRLVPLAVADPTRSSRAPNVPTLVEAGYKDIVSPAWQGLYAPKGTPPEVIRTLNTHVNEILKMPDVVAKIHGAGANPSGGLPEDLAKATAENFHKMSKIIKDLGITAD